MYTHMNWFILLLLSKHQPNAGAYNESGTFGARKVLDDWSLLGRDKGERETERETFKKPSI